MWRERESSYTYGEKSIRVSHHTRLVLLLENTVLLSLGRYKQDKESLKKAFELLHQNQWYEDLDMPASIFKNWMTKIISKYQRLNEVDVYKHFKYNSECIKKEITSHYYKEYTYFLESLVAINPDIKENAFISYHYEVFPFVKVTNETPMLGLSYDAFFDYIQALIIYAASDNHDFNLHENETMMIMTEIKSYIKYRPVENTRPSDMFFAVLEVAKRTSKNHISTRFEGIVKSNLKLMTDEQDEYFLEQLKILQKSDGKHTAQEKTFDVIIEKSIEKVAPHEAKEKEAQALLKTIFSSENPFRKYHGFTPEFVAAIPLDTQEAISYMWRSIEGIMLGFYDQYHILDINKKNLYYLFTLKEFDIETFEFLLNIREFVLLSKLINVQNNDRDKLIEIMCQIYRCFEVEDESRYP
jgi:hypothetical protein